MAEFKISVRTDKVGSKDERTIKIDDEDLENMTDAEIEQMMLDEMHQMIEWDYDRTN